MTLSSEVEEGVVRLGRGEHEHVEPAKQGTSLPDASCRSHGREKLWVGACTCVLQGQRRQQGCFFFKILTHSMLCFGVLILYSLFNIMA